MRKRKGITLRMGLVLMAVAALVLIILPTASPGGPGGGGGKGGKTVVVIPTADEICDVANVDTDAHNIIAGDEDADGLLNREECLGLSTAEGATFNFDGYLTRSSDDRSSYLDPTGADLFVMLQPSDEFPPPLEDWLVHISRTQEQDGLGITPHFIPYVAGDPNDPAASRLIIERLDGTTQHCLRMAVDPNPFPGVLGFANQGNPNQDVEGVIYPVRTRNAVIEEYRYYGLLLPDDYELTIVEPYKKWVLNHEYPHMMNLTPNDVAEYGGQHYSVDDKVVMSQSVGSRASKKGIDWYIWEKFCDESKNSRQMY